MLSYLVKISWSVHSQTINQVQHKNMIKRIATITIAIAAAVVSYRIFHRRKGDSWLGLEFTKRRASNFILDICILITMRRAIFKILFVCYPSSGNLVHPRIKSEDICPIRTQNTAISSASTHVYFDQFILKQSIDYKNMFKKIATITMALAAAVVSSADVSSNEAVVPS